MRSCIPIETSRPMRGARHCGLNASCCGVGAPKTDHPLPTQCRSRRNGAHAEDHEREKSDAFVARIEEEFDDCGFGLWAVEVPNGSPFIGFVGLHRVRLTLPSRLRRSRMAPGPRALGLRIVTERLVVRFATDSKRSVLTRSFPSPTQTTSGRGR